MATDAYIRKLWQSQLDAGETEATFAEFLSAYRELDALYQEPSTPAVAQMIQGLEERVGA